MNKDREEIIDIFLKSIGEQHAKNVCDELESHAEEIEKIEYPKELDEWFEAFNKKRLRKRRYSRLWKKMPMLAGRVAAILLVTVIALGIVTFSVEAFRIEFLNFFISQDQRSVNIESRTTTEDNDALKNYSDLYILQYVPDGFHLEEITGIEGHWVMLYVNGEKTIDFLQHKGEYSISLDNERMKISYGELKNGEKAVFSESADYNSIVWENDAYNFILGGNMDMDTLKEMAENINWK